MHTNCDVSHRTSVLLYDLYGSARFCLFTMSCTFYFTMSCTFYVSEIKVKQTNKQTNTHMPKHVAEVVSLSVFKQKMSTHLYFS